MRFQDFVGYAPANAKKIENGDKGAETPPRFLAPLSKGGRSPCAELLVLLVIKMRKKFY